MNAIRLFYKSGPKEVGTVYLFNEANEGPNTLRGVRQRSVDHRPSSEGKCSPGDFASWPRWCGWGGRTQGRVQRVGNTLPPPAPPLGGQEAPPRWGPGKVQGQAGQAALLCSSKGQRLSSPAWGIPPAAPTPAPIRRPNTVLPPSAEISTRACRPPSTSVPPPAQSSSTLQKRELPRAENPGGRACCPSPQQIPVAATSAPGTQPPVHAPWGLQLAGPSATPSTGPAHVRDSKDTMGTAEGRREGRGGLGTRVSLKGRAGVGWRCAALDSALPG
ncbi:hypothetical protein HPG69_013466 [Diceros bicornis minor]|uniref:Uncharacterized protein n=1 Tax=Diceros bicornis minor TaxID=77932 RepID=A0A7J7E982_DICBM|nr:hypothetical protein HPG69_013466 [Diceros bicornis minor]